MKITSHYNATAFWRVFEDCDIANALGLKDGTLNQGRSVEYNGDPFVKLEFKKGWFLGEIIKPPSVFFTRGNVELKADGSTYEWPNDWSLPKTEFTNWMNVDTIQNRTLFEITLPGTHDTGAWQLSRCLIKDSVCGLPDAFPDGAITALPLLPVYKEYIGLVQNMSLAQAKSVSEQLNDGVRTFDLRAAYSPTFHRFHTAHGLIGIPISYILQEIKQFLNRTAREIVIIELGTGSSTNDANWPKLKDLVNAAFGTRLVSPDIDLKRAKLADLTKGVGSRVILLSGRQGYRNYDLMADTWANTMKMDELKQKVREHINNSQGQLDKLVALPWSLTPQAPPDILDKLKAAGVPTAIIGVISTLLVAGVEGVVILIAIILIIAAFSKDILVKILPDLLVNLREVATKANAELEGFIKDLEKTGKQRINIVTTDHYDTSPAVRIARERSLSPS